MKKIKYGIILFSIVCNQGIKAQTWSALGNGITGSNNPYVFTLTSFDSILYAGGYFNKAGTKTASNIAQWDGTTWNSLGSGITGGDSGLNGVRALIIYKGKLYAGGNFTYAGGVQSRSIAVWDGIKWDSVGSGISGSGASVYCFTIFNGFLYVGGSFTGISSNLARWDGSKWDSVGFADIVTTLDVLNNNLYIGYPGGVSIYTGTTWNPLISLSFWIMSNQNSGLLDAMTTYSGNLIIGGWFTDLGDSDIYQWNGSIFSAVGRGTNGEVQSLASYNGKLYAGGEFTIAGSTPTGSIAQWDGTNWAPIGTGIGPEVFAIAVFNNSLYAAGRLNSVGINNIAKWSLSTGLNELKNNNSLTIFPNPSNGIFTIHSSEDIGASSIEIYNVLGEKVNFNHQIIKSPNYQIDLSSQPSGVYFYRVLSEGTPMGKEDGTLIGEGKVVIQK